MKRKHAAALLLGVALVICVAILAKSGLGEQQYRSFPSPDERFRIVVFRQRSLFAVTPGQAGDAPGTVKLLDRNGKVLQLTRVDMVQLVDRVDWSPGRVTIKMIAEWDLPGP